MRLWIAALAVIGAATPARADQIRHPAGFKFKLPDIGTPWEQDKRSELIIVNDASDKVPELHVVIFPVSNPRLGLEEIKRNLDGELSNWDTYVEKTLIETEKVRPFKVLDAKPEQIADAQALVGHATMGGLKAGFAIVQRKGAALILIGVPKGGIYERGMRTFMAIVHGLQPLGPNDISRDLLPSLPGLAGIRDVTATSTYDDKRNHYDVRRVVAYDALEDKTPGQEGKFVPRTGWCEGKPDEGIGETVTIQLAAPTRLDEIRIAAGVWRTQKLFESNNRITSLDVLLDGKKTTIAPPAKREWTSVAVGASVSTIVLRIAAVAKGKMNDSCLTAIELVRDGETLTPLLGVDGAAAESLPRALATLQTALDKKSGLEPLLDKTMAARCAKEKFRCYPARVDPNDYRPALVDGNKPGIVEVTFPSHTEQVDVWRLQWQGGAWRLQAVDVR
jgi:hypothetical protein